MKNILPLSLAAALAFATPGIAAAGTLADTINAGGALSYTKSTVAGSEVDVDLHGGFYVIDSVLVGGDLMLRDNKAVTEWELTATSRFHFADPFLTDEDGPLSNFSPYVGIRVGFASGDNSAKDESGLVAALRAGFDFFFTDNFALDLYADFAAATADVFADKAKMESTQIRLHVGIDLFF